MIDLYYWPAPNGHKISMMLEECDLDYTIHPINITAGDQFRPDFLKLSPNNRMPAIVDHDPVGGGPPINLFESGAILLYLAEKTGRFFPTDLRERYCAMKWLMWQMGGLGQWPDKIITSVDLRLKKFLTRLIDTAGKQPACMVC